MIIFSFVIFWFTFFQLKILWFIYDSESPNNFFMYEYLWLLAVYLLGDFYSYNGWNFSFVFKLIIYVYFNPFGNSDYNWFGTIYDNFCVFQFWFNGWWFHQVGCYGCSFLWSSNLANLCLKCLLFFVLSCMILVYWSKIFNFCLSGDIFSVLSFLTTVDNILNSVWHCYNIKYFGVAVLALSLTVILFIFFYSSVLMSIGSGIPLLSLYPLNNLNCITLFFCSFFYWLMIFTFNFTSFIVLQNILFSVLAGLFYKILEICSHFVYGLTMGGKEELNGYIYSLFFLVFSLLLSFL